MNLQVWIAILVGLAAMIDDLARRQIANWIPLSALAAGFGWQIGQSGLTGLLYAAIGTVAGFAIFLIFYLLGGMGGGDVKLMAGFGALLGFHRLLEAALWTAGVGGVIAVGVLGVRCVRRALGSTTGAATNQEHGRDSIPYAPAIALGGLVVASTQGLTSKKAERLGKKEEENKYGSQVSDGIGRQSGVCAGRLECVLSDDFAWKRP